MPRNGLSKEYVRPFEKLAKGEAGRLSVVQGILSAHRCARCHDIVSVPKLQQFSPGGLRVVGFSWEEEALQLVVRNLWRKYDWRAPNRLLVVQTGVSASQATVYMLLQ